MAVMSNRNILHDKGGALLIFMVILVLAAMATMFGLLDSDQVKLERIKANATILAHAKTALIGNSIGVDNTKRPGLMIRPDVASESPADYDGTAESGCIDATNVGGPLLASDIKQRCLGRLPWKDLGISIRGATEEDSSGIMPWFAVSANLIDPTCLGELNPNLLKLVHSPTTLNCTGTALPYPWLTVRDGSGNIVSNRVAAIILMPNEARNGQVRTLSPLGTASQYLDTLVVPAGCAMPCVAGSYSNSDMDNDFIFSSEGNPTALASHFNDQLVYITIDELIAAVEQRVASEVRKQLLDHRAVNGVFPDAATVGYQGQSCVQGQAAGFLPLPILACTGSKCDGVFPATMQFTSDLNFTSSTGACSYATNVCSCTGLGACTRATTRLFKCSSTGTCISKTTGTFHYAPAVPIDNTSLVVTGGACVVSGTSVDCTGAGHVKVNGSVNGCAAPMLNINTFPSWFTENGWKHYVYYAKGGLTVGANSASALVVSAGAAFATQSRPSSLIADYLDSAENTNGDNLYDAVGTPRSNIYNDQMFIVAP